MKYLSTRGDRSAVARRHGPQFVFLPQPKEKPGDFYRQQKSDPANPAAALGAIYGALELTETGLHQSVSKIKVTNRVRPGGNVAVLSDGQRVIAAEKTSH